MAGDPVFNVAGLGAVEERTYLFVVHRGRTKPAEVAERFGVTAATASTALEVLRQRGLLVQPEGTGAYTAVDPRSSLHAMTDQLTDQVNRIRDLIPQ
ncbi:MAG: helix-turn-helix domain-containing protein, partial [Nocardioidaceae bacterium]